MEKLVDLQCFFSWGKVEIRKLFFEGWQKKCRANNILDIHEGTLFTNSSKGEWKLLLKVCYSSNLTQLTVSFGAVCFRKAGRPEMYGSFLYLKKFIFSKKSLGGWDNSHSMADFFPAKKGLNCRMFWKLGSKKILWLVSELGISSFLVSRTKDYTNPFVPNLKPI